ncbi:MAG: RadC family protein, partial [Flavobacteriales bacterium]
MKEYEKKLTIKSWAEEDRPREKLLAKGPASLSDAELLAILIRSGNTKESAVELARKVLMDAENNLNILGKLGIRELTTRKGIGEAKAITIAAALELGRRRRQEEILQKKKITCSSDVFEIFQPMLSDLPHEEFWILLLNRANKIIGTHCISRGGIAGTVTDTRIIFKLSLEELASSIVLCHNHPSGNNKPSDSDI